MQCNGPKISEGPGKFVQKRGPLFVWSRNWQNFGDTQGQEVVAQKIVPNNHERVICCG